MAYDKQTWKNGASGGTPIDADALNHIEQGIADKAEQGPKGDTGPKGDPGADGADGPKGDTGNTGPSGSDGADGFPTEAQWDDLVARVEALETA